MQDAEPTSLHFMLRELPRKRILALVLVLVVHLTVIAGVRGREIAVERDEADRAQLYRRFGINHGCNFTMHCRGCWEPNPWPDPSWVGPWRWTADEWRQTTPWS